MNRLAHRSFQILLLAAWFGLVSGLVEGIGLLVFQTPGWTIWKQGAWALSAEIIWISALFDLFFFTVVGLTVIAAQRIFLRLPATRVALFLFTYLTFFDWLALSGRIRHIGVLFLAAGLASIVVRWFRQREEAALQFCLRSLRWVAGAALVALVGIQGGFWLRERLAIARLPAALSRFPNILVIVVDTLRADHLSAYGYSRKTSPNLDRIAGQGVLFTNAIATSSWTLPSHASLLTGLYPHDHWAEIGPLDGRHLTLAEALRALGYRTGAFSANVSTFSRKMGLGRGFIHFEDAFQSFADMFAHTLFGTQFEEFMMLHMASEEVLGRRRAADINRATLRWLDRDHGKPFLAFLNYYDPHDPYTPPPPYRTKFSKLKSPGGIINGLAGRPYPNLTPEQLQGEVDAYDGAIAYVDEQIGQLLTELQKRGLAENTLVVITSDHGESFGEHGLLTHRNGLYREVIHVPLIFWWPSHLPSGLRIEQPISNAAAAATVLDLVGVSGGPALPGRSLTELWSHPETHLDWPNPLAELAHLPFELSRNPCRYGEMKSLVSPQWQYIVHQKFGEQLYDWVRDPGEQNNLAGTLEGQAISRDLAARLQKQVEQRRRVGFRDHQ